MRQAAALVSIFVGLVVIPAATASKPVVVPPEPVPDFTDTACGYDILVHTPVNKEVTRIFSDGRIHVSGALREEVSAHGKTITLNIPGPATIIVAPDGSATLYGHGVGAGDFLTPDGVRFLQVAGPVSFPLDGSIPPLQGHVLLDICAALS